MFIIVFRLNKETDMHRARNNTGQYGTKASAGNVLAGPLGATTRSGAKQFGSSFVPEV
jgi:hypothetical protein